MHYSLRSDFWSFCELQVKRVVFGQFGAKHKKKEKYWLPRRDVTTSRCLVNRSKSTSDPTSRRHSVATSQHRDVTTISAPASLNAKGDLILRGSENIRTKGRKVEQQRPGSLEKTLSFVFLLFCKTKLLMISRLIMCILKSSMF